MCNISNIYIHIYIYIYIYIFPHSLLSEPAGSPQFQAFRRRHAEKKRASPGVFEILGWPNKRQKTKNNLGWRHPPRRIGRDGSPWPRAPWPSPPRLSAWRGAAGDGPAPQGLENPRAAAIRSGRSGNRMARIPGRSQHKHAFVRPVTHKNRRKSTGREKGSVEGPGKSLQRCAL